MTWRKILTVLILSILLSVIQIGMNVPYWPTILIFLLSWWGALVFNWEKIK